MKTFLALKTIVALALLNICTHALAKQAEGYIKVPGGSVWYHIEGSPNKTPILLIHGGPGGNSCALAPLKKMSADRQVIFYDQLGAGKSEQPKDDSLWTTDRFVEELDSVRKALGLKKVHLLAHSWGAAIAAQYLETKGTEGVESFIFVGPYLNSEDWIQGTKQLRQQLKPEIVGVLQKHEAEGTTNSAEYQQASDHFYQLFLFKQPHKDPNECKNSAWNGQIYEQMWGHSEFMVTGTLKGFDAAQQLKKINIPVLFLIGEYDMTPESTIEKYKKQMAHAEIKIIKNAAHMSMVDQPLVFIAETERFLKKSESPQR